MKPEMKMNIANILPRAGASMKNTPGPKAEKACGAYTTKNAEHIPEDGVAGSVTRRAKDLVLGAKFKKTLEAVTKANREAANNDAEEGQAGHTGQTSENAPGLPSDYNELAARLEAMGMSPADLCLKATGQADGETQLQQASEIIREAIARISRMLNLKINQGLENLQMANPSRNVIDQFADILNALKGIAGLLDEAVKNNQPIEISGKVFDLNQAAGVAQAVRVETFRIEMALEMAGVSGEVTQSLARKNNSPAGGGIVTAFDPSLISMPSTQINRMLGGALPLKEQSVETLFSNLAQALKGAAPDKAQLVNKIAALAADVGVTNMLASGPGDKKNTGEITVDSKILRMLLKIDKTQANNAVAAQQNEKIDLSMTMKVIFAKDLAGVEQSVDDKLGAMFSGVDGGKGQAGSLTGATDPRTSALTRTIDESVMNQLTDKVHTALKTGVTEIRLLLRPESLGEMRVKLTINGDMVMGKIYVESQQVKHIVESNLQTLKDCLAQHNLQTGSFDVNVGSDAREQLQEMAAMAQQNAAEKHGGAAENAQSPERNIDLSAGEETGRRFGTNTIEYFV